MGNLLVEKRKEMNARIADVANLIGVGATTLYHWEQGGVQSVSTGSMASVQNLAMLYDVEPEQIVQAVENNYILKHRGVDIESFHKNPTRIKGSGDDNNSSDEESIIEIAQEAADNLNSDLGRELENVDVDEWRREAEIKQLDALVDSYNENQRKKSLAEDTILCSDAVAKILDALYSWTEKRQDYDDMHEVLMNFMPSYDTLSHLTIKNDIDSITKWAAEKIYGVCRYEAFVKTVDNIKSCLTKQADWDDEGKE